MYVLLDAHRDPGKILQLQLLEFYHVVFKQENISSWSLAGPLQKLKRAYSKSGGRSGVSFDHPEMRCCYLFQYAPCFTSMVAHNFSKMLRCNPWLVEKLILADEINICSLGGGPGTEFVAVAKTLEEMLWKYCPRGDRPLKLKATVVDVDSGWKQTLRKVDGNMSRLIDTTVLRYELSFIEADLTKPPNGEVLDILRKSDIVTMAKFMTAVHGSSGREEVSSALQMIVQNIREDGILLFVDSSGFENYDILNAVTGSSCDMFQIYGLWEHEVYEMSPFFIQECCRLYFRHFSPYKPCCFRSRNYVSVWHRRPRACKCSDSSSEISSMSLATDESHGRLKN